MASASCTREVGVEWGRTTLTAPVRQGLTSEAWGDALALPADRLAHVRVGVPGLKQGTRVRVLFEDRELSAEDGGFVDDFRGVDLYRAMAGYSRGTGASR